MLAAERLRLGVNFNGQERELQVSTAWRGGTIYAAVLYHSILRAWKGICLPVCLPEESLT